MYLHYKSICVFTKMDEYNQDGEKLNLKNVHNDEITFTYDFDMFDTIRNQAGWTVLIEKVKEMLDTDLRETN